MSLDVCGMSFQELKRMFTMSPRLILPNLYDQFEMYYDSSY